MRGHLLLTTQQRSRIDVERRQLQTQEGAIHVRDVNVEEVAKPHATQPRTTARANELASYR